MFESGQKELNGSQPRSLMRLGVAIKTDLPSRTANSSQGSCRCLWVGGNMQTVYADDNQHRDDASLVPEWPSANIVPGRVPTALRPAAQATEACAVASGICSAARSPIARAMSCEDYSTSVEPPQPSDARSPD